MSSDNAPFADVIRRPPDYFDSDGVPTIAYSTALTVDFMASGSIHRAIASSHA